MSYHNTAAVNVRARKRHCCTWCGEKIEAGEIYKKWCCIGDDGPMTNKMHNECHAAMGRWIKAQPGEFEFGSGEFTRGCVCESGDSRHGSYSDCDLAGSTRQSGETK